ncbi:MAG: hypothetical protein M0Z66_07975 [Thermaerobacter sp.]|nr:hypothetical protein [Thermaerobacter sp.]
MADMMPDDSHPQRYEPWAVRALWIVLLATAGFAAWVYAEGGLLTALVFVATELIVWIWGIFKVGMIFAVLSLGLSAWPGARSLWLGTTVVSVLVSVPWSIYSADATVYSLPHPALRSAFWEYLLVHNWPEVIAFALVVLVVTTWVTRLYFPKLRGWYFAIFWTVTVAWLLMLPATLPLG